MNTNVQRPLQAGKACFSYIRFSSKGQTKGTSEDRQAEIAPRVARARGWNLREDLNASDLGVSAFKGNNIKTLESIINAVKVGKIPQGSVMIVEAFDRFSRADLDTAEDLLKSALKAGLEIYIDRGSHHLTRESISKPIDRIIALLELAAANEYSAKLSQRIKVAYAASQKAMARGEVIKNKKTCPKWIDLATWKPNSLAPIVASLFTSYLSGLGTKAIERKLNEEKAPTLSGKGHWDQGTIFMLLRDTRVIGERPVGNCRNCRDGSVTETIKGYYPAIVERDTFLKVQARFADNSGKRTTGTGNTGRIANIFSGVAFCTCGSAIKVTGGKQCHYVTCHSKAKGIGCKAPSFRYSLLENSLVNLLKLDPRQLVRDANGDTISANIQILNGRLAETRKQIDNISEALAIKVNKSLVLKQAELEEQASEIKAQIDLEAAQAVSLNGSFEKLADIVARLENLSTDVEFRARVQGWVRENINRITVNRAAKTFTVDLKTGNVITMGLNGALLEVKSVTDLMTGEKYVWKNPIAVAQ